MSVNESRAPAADMESPEDHDRDRIAQAYLGLIGSPRMQERARARINWMAANARGPKILDIGCSEGILALLLARAGHEVVGIDVNAAAIAYGQSLLESEPADVRARVSLRVGDALGVDLPPAAFDTVVLGEVIEHLAEPEPMLHRAAELMKPGGRLVLTTPFGHFPHPDHRQEFRTSQLVDLITTHFALEELSIVDGYFRVLALERGAARSGSAGDGLLQVTEEAAIAIQRQFYADLGERTAQLRKLRNETRILVEKNRRLERLARRLQEERRINTERLRRSEQQLKRQKRIVAMAQARVKELRRSRRYELGRALEKAVGSPGRMLKLPFRVAKIYRKHRARAANVGTTAAGATESDVSERTSSKAAQAPTTAGPEIRPATPHLDISAAFPPYAYPDRPPRTAIKVASILDEFSDACFRYEAELNRLTKEDWRRQLERDRPEFLFVESAWKGNQENWRRVFTHAEEREDGPLDELIAYCRKEGIPTVFWNKEDPPNFDVFIGAARKFDYIFTTDANCIEKYRLSVGHERIFALPFAAQPAIHNPMGKVETDEHEIAFAGTWYGQKHVERGALLPIVLDAAVGHKLHIFDRMSGHTRNDFYLFPPQYAPYLRTALPYPSVLTAYRNFKVFLNVNSVTDSPTMFARRVFEVLASATAVVSTASTGIEEMLGDVVAVVHDEDEARTEIERLLRDPWYRWQKSHQGYRKVLRRHTYTQRFRTIARTIGLELTAQEAEPLVSVVIPLDDGAFLDNALASLARQRHAPLEAILVVRAGARDAAERFSGAWPEGRVVEVAADAAAPALWQAGIGEARGEFVTVFDPAAVYGAEFISDLLLAFDYAGTDLVGKAAHYVSSGGAPELIGARHRYQHVDQVPAAALLARGRVFEEAGFDRIVAAGPGGALVARAPVPGRIYSADPFNYLRLEGQTDQLASTLSCGDPTGLFAPSPFF